MRNKDDRLRRTEDRVVFLFTVALLGLVALTFASMSLAPLRISCLRCHTDTWRSHGSDIHAEVTCQSCHGGSTLPERIGSRIDFARMITSTVLGREPETTRVADQACLRCHAREIGAPIISQTGIRISHAEKTAGGLVCTDCHAETGHSLPGQALRRVDMFECFTCHRSMESARCEICHAGTRTRDRREYQSAWRLTHGGNWQALHGMGGLENCRACHSPRYCVKCHGVELPHPSGFHYRHGAEATSVNAEETCGACHDQSLFCYSCHQIEMPHPAGFLQAHPSTAENDEETCLTCHERGACDYCHDDHQHPEIPEEDMRQLQRRLGLE